MSGFVAGPVDLNAPRESVPPPASPAHRCTRPPQAGARLAHANGGTLRPGYAQPFLPRGARRVAAVPRLPAHVQGVRLNHALFVRKATSARLRDCMRL